MTITPVKAFSAFGLLALIYVPIILAMFSKGCFTPDSKVAPTVTTTRTSDTAINRVTGTSDKVIPIVLNTQAAAPSSVPIQYIQPSTDIKELTQTVKDLAAQLYAINHYENNVTLKDSSGKKVGEVNLKQDVTQNKLQPFTPTYKLDLPVITNTVTTTIDHPYVPRNQLYLGGGILGDQFTPVKYFKAGVIFKNKRDLAIEVNAIANLKGIGAEFGVYKLISFRKK